tara:strand:- start:3668 stop:3841 length:174 start_codon:yes stop_codon:yes gene_type:complete
MNKLSIVPNAAIAGIYSTLSCPSVIMDDAKLQQHVKIDVRLVLNIVIYNREKSETGR